MNRSLKIKLCFLMSTLWLGGCTPGFVSNKAVVDLDPTGQGSFENYQRVCNSVDQEIPEKPLSTVTSVEYLNIAQDILPASADLSALAKVLNSWSPISQTFHFKNNSPLLSDEALVNERLSAAEELAKLMVQAQLVDCAVKTSKSRVLACFDKFKPIAEKLFRKSIASDKWLELKNLFAENYDEANKLGFDDPYEQALGAGFIAALMSPEFLFKYEVPLSPDAGGVKELSAFELASRLSFYLGGSVPDKELLDLAKSGALLGKDVLRQQAQRLLDKAGNLDRFITNFTEQWLGYKERFNEADTLYLGGPTYKDVSLESSFIFKELVEKGAIVSDLVRPGFSYVNGRLAEHYGLSSGAGENFERVPSSQRGGLFQQASFLTATSKSGRTIPALRGIWALDRFLCSSVGFNQGEPASAEEIAESKKRLKKLPVHEQVREHSKNPACASCHSRMDPVGLGLENYDAFGNWRSNYSDGQPVVSHGVIFKQPYSNSKDFVSAVHQSDNFSDCVKKKFISFATALDPYKNNGCSLDQLDAGSSQKTIKDSIIDAVTVDAFRKVRFSGGTE